jgi:hypothetical protein|tara:strand:- start:637 stop:846 length:210 start_codon:yes stop_codon:yes gene_type:complete
MSFMKNLIADHKEEIINKIFDDEMQKKIVEKLNENIDIPIISEKTEEKILNAIYDSVEEVVKATIIEKL